MEIAGQAVVVSGNDEESLRRAFKGSHILSINDLNRQQLELIVEDALKIDSILKEDERSLRSLLAGKRMCLIFYQPSTRTAMSFKTAAFLSGMEFDGILDPKVSSAAKGEILIDTIRTTAGYFFDVYVIRHTDMGSVRRASEYAFYPENHRLQGQSISVLNGGDGPNQHPTQTMTDLSIIKKKMGQIDDLVYLFNDDLKYGRTVHSLSEALLLFSPKKVYFCSSSHLRMPEMIIDEYRKKGVAFEEIDRYEDVLREVDVFYDTRPQLGDDMSDELKERVKNVYTVRASAIQNLAKKDMIILHPLPRDGKFFSPEAAVDDLPQACYFQQAHMGPAVRVGGICLLMGVRI